MTALAGGPTGSGTPTEVDLPEPARVQRDVPAPAPDTLLLGPQLGSGYVSPPALVRRGDGQILQLTPLLYTVMEAIDGRRSYEDVARAASQASGRTVLADDVRTLIDGKLRPLGLVLGENGSLPPLRRANPLLALRPKFVVSNPRVTRSITAPFALLFHPVLVVLGTVAFAVVAFWVLFDKGLASAAYDAFQRPGLLLAVFAVTVVSAGFHEFGHAAALRRGGGVPGAMGAGLYLIWPAFYTDVTDSYRLSRAQRIRVDLGGLYFNALVSLVMFGGWALTHWDGLLLVIAAQILQMIRQLPPLVRFDGYHLLADVTGVPDLFHRIGPTLRSFLPRRWRHAESRALRPWVRATVGLWVVVVVPLLLVSAVVSVLALPRILGTTAHSVALQSDALAALSGRGDIAGAAVKVLAILALVVPVGGILLMLVRAGRSYGLRLWRATQGKPRHRAIATVAMAGVVAGLAFAWWPHGGTYRPIEAYERGTLQDVLPSLGASGLAPGRELTAKSIWIGADRVPPASAPALALVLRPRTAGAGPTWVFPFNRPAAPGAGGNQAMAVVTRDGGVAYDVAFALVWADGSTVLNRNEAYAFADCTACRAVAVSFQVVLIVGHANVVAPQNIAAAVNYGCVQCVTEAIATQLVLTLPHQLSAQAREQLDRLWAAIEAFQTSLRSLSFAQIQQQIADFERQIIAIVRPDVALVTPTTAPSATPSTTTTAGLVGGSTAAPNASASAGAGAVTTPAPTSSPPDSAVAPSPTGSGSPSPSASSSG